MLHEQYTGLRQTYYSYLLIFVLYQIIKSWVCILLKQHILPLPLALYDSFDKYLLSFCEYVKLYSYDMIRKFMLSDIIIIIFITKQLIKHSFLNKTLGFHLFQYLYLLKSKLSTLGIDPYVHMSVHNWTALIVNLKTSNIKHSCNN